MITNNDKFIPPHWTNFNCHLTEAMIAFYTFYTIDYTFYIIDFITKSRT